MGGRALEGPGEGPKKRCFAIQRSRSLWRKRHQALNWFWDSVEMMGCIDGSTRGGARACGVLKSE